MFRTFQELTDAARARTVPQPMAIAAAGDGPVIDAALRADREGIAEPIYVGDGPVIRELLRQRDVDPSRCRIVEARPGEEGKRAVELVSEGSAAILMKGMMETRDFLSPIVHKDSGLSTGRIMSHAVFFQLPNYHKLLMTSDGGMVMYPTLEDKKHIIQNATIALRAMGYLRPSHGVVCAIEKVNPKMIETVEAAELQKMNETGEIGDCVVIGPISYDVAMDPEIARHKGFDCPYAGNFDCLIMPNMQAGNILGKCFMVTAGATMAGIVVGARVPVVMASRGADAEEKFHSIAMAALAAGGMEHGS